MNAKKVLKFFQKFHKFGVELRIGRKYEMSRQGTRNLIIMNEEIRRKVCRIVSLAAASPICVKPIITRDAK